MARAQHRREMLSTLIVVDRRAGERADPLAPCKRHRLLERAVAHLFNVAAGLDSLAVGESQILAQLRESLREGQRSGRIGPVMSRLVQQALRVGKRVHSETGIDTVSRSLVERALDLSGNMLGDLTGVRAVVVGAGAMSSLATHTLVRHGLGEVTVVNRTFDAARRLADAAVAGLAPLDGGAPSQPRVRSRSHGPPPRPRARPPRAKRARAPRAARAPTCSAAA